MLTLKYRPMYSKIGSQIIYTAKIFPAMYKRLVRMSTTPMNRDMLLAASCFSCNREFQDARLYEIPDLLELQTSCCPVEGPMSVRCKPSRTTIPLTRVPRHSAACALSHYAGSTWTSPVDTYECCQHRSSEAGVQVPVDIGRELSEPRS